MNKVSKHRRYDDIIFHINKQGYYIHGYIFLHRYIWEKFNGQIPKGYHVHHRDLNPENNILENLELLTSSQHQSLHHIGNKFCVGRRVNLGRKHTVEEIQKIKAHKHTPEQKQKMKDAWVIRKQKKEII